MEDNQSEGPMLVFPWDMVHPSKWGDNGDWGRTALHHAARECATETVVRLIWDGYDINKKDDVGWTPLMHALGSMNYDGKDQGSIHRTISKHWTVRTLLAAGASMDGIEEISENCYSEQIRQLLKEYKDKSK